MIRKANRFEMSAMDPTPEEIRERTEAIRKTWSPRERARRSRFKQARWMPPMFSDFEVPGLSVADFESR